MSLRGIFDRLRGRRRWVPPFGDGRSTEDWHSGDLAECIDPHPWLNLATGQIVEGPKRGDLLRVSGVGMFMGHIMLSFVGHRDRWTAIAFRKIRPAKIEAADRSFIRQMKRLRPTVDA